MSKVPGSFGAIASRGGRSSRKNRAISRAVLAMPIGVMVSGVVGGVHFARAATYVRTSTAGSLNDTNYIPIGGATGTTPGSGDIALFNVATGAAQTDSVGAAFTLGQLAVTNPTGAVTITDTSNELTLNGVNGLGIAMGSATQNLTINAGLILGAPQQWNVASGRTLLISNTAFGFNQGGYNLNVVGAGTTYFQGSVVANTGVGGAGATLSTVSGTLEFYGNVAADVNVIDPNTALSLSGTTLLLTQAASTGAFTQNFASLSIAAGPSVLNETRGSSSSIVTNIGGATIARSVGGTLNINPTNNGSYVGVATTANTNGIIGGWATLTSSDFAAATGTGTTIVAPTYTTDTWGTTTNTTVIAASNTITNGTTNSLRFANASSATVTLSGTNVITSGGILVSTSVTSAFTDTITGGILEGAAGTDLVVSHFGAGILNISSSIADNGAPTALTKSGTGTLLLNGTNTFTGGVYLNQGVLEIGSTGFTNALGSNAIIFSNGSSGILALGGNSYTFPTPLFTPYVVSSAGVGIENLSATPASLTVNVSGTNTFIGNLLDGTGGGSLSLKFTGSGTQILGGTNSYTGTTNISSGVTLQLGTGTTGGFTSSGAIIDNGALVSYVSSVTTTSISGSGSFNVAAGTFNMNGGTASTYTGATTISAGSTVLITGTNNALPYGAGTSDITVNGVLQLAGYNINVNGLNGSGTIDPSGSGGGTRTFTFGNNNSSGTFSGNFSYDYSGSTRILSIVKTGSGTEVLTGVSYYATGTHPGSTTISGGTLQIGNGTNTTASIGTNGIADNANLAFDYNGAFTVTNVISGTGSVTQLGSAPLTLSAANTFTGGLNINSSTLFAGTQAGVLGTGTVTIAANSTLDLNGNNQTTGLLSSTASSAIVTNSGGSNATITISGTMSQSFAGVLQAGPTNTFSLTKLGTGTQTLTGVSTYVGATNIAAGTAVLSSTGGLGNTAISVSSGATFATRPVSGTINIGTAGSGSLGATLLLNPGTGTNVGATLSLVDGAIGVVDLNQQSGFSGTALTLGGSGSASNAPILGFDLGSSSADELVVSTGSVTVGATGALVQVTPLSGVTGLTPGNYTIISAPGGGLSPLNLSASSIVLGGNSYSLSLANSTSVAEILTVATNNTTPIYAYYTGANGTSWSATSPTNFATTHTGTTPTNGIPGGGSNVFMTADNANTANLSTTLDGVFNINSLTFTGTGTAAATTSVTIAAGANNGSLTLTPTNSFQTASGTNYGPGTGLLVMAGSAAHTISAPVILGTTQTWEIDNSASNPLTVSGVVSDGGLGYSLTKTGPGTLVLSGSNTYGGLTGYTNISAGTLITGAVNALPAGLGLTVGNNATLDLNGFNQSISTLSDGGFSTSQIISTAGPATLSLTNAGTNSFSGTFNSSNLTFSKGGAGLLSLTAPTNTLASYTQLAGSVNMSGATSFTGNASIIGTLTLSSTASLLGGTTAPITITDNGNLTLNGGVITTSAFTANSNGLSAIFITGGSLTVAGNLALDNDNGNSGGYLSLTGGIVTANSATLGRSGYNATGTITAGSTGAGFYVNGGTLNIATTLGIGTLGATNSNANVRLDSGSITVGGVTTIADPNSGRYGLLDVSGGTFTGPTIQLGANNGNAATVNSGEELLVRGTGVVNVNTISAGFATQTGGTNLIDLLGGTLYVGAGGIVNVSGGTVVPTFNVGGTAYATAPLLAASAPWATAFPITLTASSSGVLPTIQAANASGGAESITLNGAIGGTGGFIKTGAGTLYLTAPNFYTGVTTLNAGILNINGQFALGGAVYTGILFNGGTLQYSAAFSGNGTGDISENSNGTAVPVTIAAGGATIDTDGNAVTFASPVGNAGTGTLYVTDSLGTGSLTLTGTNTYTGGTNVSAGATLIVGSSGALPSNRSLTVVHGGFVQIANHSSNATYVPLVSTLNNKGTIDITNNAMIFTNTSTGAITAQVAAAYNKGAWNGTSATNGVITSSVAASDTTYLTAVGIATGLTTFEGQTVPASDVLVKYTYYGDANLSGTVDGSDYSLIDNGFTLGLTGWYNGDFNYDGVIDGSDYALIDNSFNTQGATIAGEVASATAQIAGLGASSAVPEPTALGLLGMGAVGLLGRRRRAAKLAAATR